MRGLFILALLLAVAAIAFAAPVAVELFYDDSERSEQALSLLEKAPFTDPKSVRLTLVPSTSSSSSEKASDLLAAQLCALEEATATSGLVVKIAALVHCLKTWAPQIIGYIAYCWVSNYAGEEAGTQIKKIETCASARRNEVLKGAEQASLGVTTYPTIKVNGEAVNTTQALPAVCQLTRNCDLMTMKG